MRRDATRGRKPAGTAASRKAARQRREAALPWLLILPSIILAGGIIVYPFYEIVNLSLHDVSRFGQVHGFVGARNFHRIFADPVFLLALLRTLEWTVAVVGGTILLSMPVALVLNQRFWGRGLARTIVMLPWAVSLPMAAIVWLWSFNGDHGMINGILQQLGLIARPIQFMARASSAFPVEIAVGIWASIPFTAIILLGGLGSIPGDIYEAARIDGANGMQQFRWMTLPLLNPFIAIAVVLNVIYVFNSFPIIWVMTQGGPDNSTHILVTYLYELAFRLGRPAPAAAVSLVGLAIVFAFTALYLRMQARQA